MRHYPHSQAAFAIGEMPKEEMRVLEQDCSQPPDLQQMVVALICP